MLPAVPMHLISGVRFTQGVLPVGLAHLKFDLCFNQSLAAGALPAVLTHLELGLYFNQP